MSGRRTSPGALSLGLAVGVSVLGWMGRNPEQVGPANPPFRLVRLTSTGGADATPLRLEVVVAWEPGQSPPDQILIQPMIARRPGGRLRAWGASYDWGPLEVTSGTDTPAAGPRRGAVDPAARWVTRDDAGANATAVRQAVMITFNPAMPAGTVFRLQIVARRSGSSIRKEAREDPTMQSVWDRIEVTGR